MSKNYVLPSGHCPSRTVASEQPAKTGTSLQGTSGDNVEQRMFSVLVDRKHPRLMEVFDRLECSLAGLTGEWFSRMFTTALPAETAARVWDCIMVEGPKVLFRAALSLIKVQLLYLSH